MRRTLLPILIATLAFPAIASASYPHVVGAGESLYSVAAADGLSVSDLAAANGLSPDAQLVAGSTLMIPPQTAAGAQGTAGAVSQATAAQTATAVGDGDSDSDDQASTGAATAATSSGAPGSYVVQPGDTLSAIAARAGLSVAQLAAQNGLDPNGTLLAGTALALSGSASATAIPVSTGTASAATQPVGTVAEGSASAPPYPTPERVSASQVGAIAAANGVPPSLAEAVGWQESGFNNDLVSTADARGVMQILPGTWDWIQRTLTAGAPLAPASAADNVRGGVLLLHSLLDSTGGSPSLAAAGYYQGLSSVQQHGLFPSTRQYVQSVLALSRRFGGG
jgi:LysM repeat protein